MSDRPEQDLGAGPIWSAALADASGDVDQLFSNGRLFAGNAGHVYELSADNGQVRHHRSLGADCAGAVTHLATDGADHLFAGAGGCAYGIALGSDWSSFAWPSAAKVGRRDATVSLLAMTGRLFAGASGSVTELRPSDGAVVHARSLSGIDEETRIVADVADSTRLYAGADGKVGRLDLANPAGWAWSQPVGRPGTLVSVAAANGRLYAICLGTAYELSTSDGSILHSLSLPGAATLVADGRYLHVGAADCVYGVLLDDWSLAWSAPFQRSGLISLASSGGRLFTGASGCVHELDPARGAILHSLQLSNAPGPGDDPYGTSIVAVGADGKTALQLYAGTRGHSYRLPAWSRRAAVFAIKGAASYTELFVVSTDGTLYHTAISQISWGNWTNALDPPGRTQSVFAINGPTGNTELFAVSADGTLSHNWLSRPYVWHGWEENFDGASVMGSVLSVFAINEWDEDVDPVRTHVFAVGANGTLYYDFLDGYGTWHGWAKDLDAPRKTQSVFAVKGASGNIELFAVSADGTLCHNWLDSAGHWRGWEENFDGASVMGSVLSVFAIEGATGNTEVFAVSADGTLYHDVLSRSGWRGWTKDLDPQRRTQSVFAIEGATGNTEVFAVSADGTLYHNWLVSDGWRSWQENFDGASVMGPVLSVFAINEWDEDVDPVRTHVFAVGANGTIYYDFLDRNATWHGWTPVFDGTPKVRP